MVKRKVRLPGRVREIDWPGRWVSVVGRHYAYAKYLLPNRFISPFQFHSTEFLGVSWTIYRIAFSRSLVPPFQLLLRSKVSKHRKCVLSVPCKVYQQVLNVFSPSNFFHLSISLFSFAATSSSLTQLVVQISPKFLIHSVSPHNK